MQHANIYNNLQGFQVNGRFFINPSAEETRKLAEKIKIEAPTWEIGIKKEFIKRGKHDKLKDFSKFICSECTLVVLDPVECADIDCSARYCKECFDKLGTCKSIIHTYKQND